MIASFAGQTVTRLRGTTGTDAYGNTVSNWDNPNSLDVSPCTVQPIAGSETFDTGGGRLTSRWSLHAAADADIETGDRISYGGTIYDIDGSVRRFPSPSGNLAHVEVMLQRREHAQG